MINYPWCFSFAKVTLDSPISVHPSICNQNQSNLRYQVHMLGLLNDLAYFHSSDGKKSKYEFDLFIMKRVHHSILLCFQWWCPGPQSLSSIHLKPATGKKCSFHSSFHLQIHISPIDPIKSFEKVAVDLFRTNRQVKLFCCSWNFNVECHSVISLQMSRKLKEQEYQNPL